MNNATENKESAVSAKTPHMPSKTAPKIGQRFRCRVCGMEVQVTAECKCNPDQVHFECCDQEMQRL
jgi:hypothetical protein